MAAVFGLTIEKLIVIGVIAGLILGPDRLTQFAAVLGRTVRRARTLLASSKERIEEEFPDIDWKKVDPRQYNPRRIIADALTDDWKTLGDAPATDRAAAKSVAQSAEQSARNAQPPAEPAPPR